MGGVGVGQLVNRDVPVSGAEGVVEIGANFAFSVLPTIIFFASLMGVLYHLGLMQKVVQGMGWVMFKVLRISGAESLSVAANVFVGQIPESGQMFIDHGVDVLILEVGLGGRLHGQPDRALALRPHSALVGVEGPHSFHPAGNGPTSDDGSRSRG